MKPRRTAPFYFPLRHGRYEVAPGLNRFGKELGGGDADRVAFQFDNTFDRFRAAKLASRSERFDKYVCESGLSEDVASEVAKFISGRLATEQFPPTAPNTNRPLEVLDTLACQVQEDLAIVSVTPERHWISYLHVCLPNGWAPEEKIGRSFAAIHEPVAGMAEMNRREDEFAQIMVRATDGLVRFAWGVTFDDELNHHPDRPKMPFDPTDPRAFLRVERQTIWGFPRVGAALFTIRTYLYDCKPLRRDPSTRDPLVAALRTMPQASAEYKGIAPYRDDLVQWLATAE